MNKQGVLTKLSEHADEIRKRFSVKAISIFGSIVRDEAGDDSDVDVLVTFEHKATFDGFMDLKFYLEELLGRRVDLVTENALRPRMRRAIQEELIRVA
ncbi:MAG TPA: nucleotidyltransferase family protein [Sedimentisphaerales bacterium]|nr:nucleotidyltransferase family protein [Sedimentisphaerales bacterium]